MNGYEYQKRYFDGFEYNKTFINELKKIEPNKYIIFDKPLDYISKIYYGTESLWWVIGLYNNIIDADNPTYQELKIISKSDLNDLFIKMELNKM